jgi:hypothetical protein
VVFIEDLTPISVEEMPPSNIFFNKKRKPVVRREVHHKEGVLVKWHRVMYDGKAQEEIDFTTYETDLLGSFSTANQF